MDVIELLPCPFCGGEAEGTKQYENAASGCDYKEYYVVKCTICGSKGTAYYAKCFRDFTKYNVDDFDLNPNLRETVEKEYDLYIKDLKSRAAAAWNYRI